MKLPIQSVKTGKKIITTTLLIIILSLGGCMFLLRGCLSKYDERSAIPPVLYFDANGKQVLLSIVKYEKATSYTRKGGFTSKSVSTTYFLQTNDALTGDKLMEQKIKHNSDIKEHPVETMGAVNNMAWVFIGELMAFDPITLEKKADVAMLEQKNTSLKGKFPKERRYYKFNRNNGTISITATDGSKWILNTATLLGVPADDNITDEPYASELQHADALEKRIDIEIDSMNKVMNGTGQREAFYKLRGLLYKKRDSLRIEKHIIEKLQRGIEQRKSAIESLARMSPGYTSMMASADSANRKYYGLLSAEEYKNLNNRFDYRSQFDESSRRKLYITMINTDRNGDELIELANAVNPNPSQSFLHGGFLLDKKTGMPLHLPDGWLVIHKTQIGKEGLNQVSKMNRDGKVIWTTDTRLHDWVDWFATAQHLYIFGVNNEELSSGQCNLLLIVDLANGKTIGYDYFTDKPVTNL